MFPSSAHVSPSRPLVFNSLDMSRSVSVTTAGQCRLAPLIQVILDCSHLYDYAVKLLFKLHSCEYSRLDLWKLLAARLSLERGSSPPPRPAALTPAPGALDFLLLFQKALELPAILIIKDQGQALLYAGTHPACSSGDPGWPCPPPPGCHVVREPIVIRYYSLKSMLYAHFHFMPNDLFLSQDPIRVTV